MARHNAQLGLRLPELRTEVPGPKSLALAERLRRVESPNVTALSEHGPIFWAEARGANVRDVDGNVYVDVTAGFGVSAAGHGNPAVTDAAADQLRRLTHAMGDVHPAAVKVALLERLAALAPGDLSVSILSANGSDAVESALKTAVLATGRTGVVAFHGAYHGLGYGALSVTSSAHFRGPFEAQLMAGVRFAPFPGAEPNAESGAGTPVTTARALAAVRDAIGDAAGGPHPVGAVIVEPIQGRGGVRVPPDDFLPQLRSLCDHEDVLLIFDEIYTGLGRTGRWFACLHRDVVPDVLLVGKSLAGGLPLSAAIGTPGVMGAWPASSGEAMHTSTFLGNPVTCAAALAQLDALERDGLVERAAELGRWLAGELDTLVHRQPMAASHRGLGLMRALALTAPADGDPPAAGLAARLLADGVIVLPEGDALAFTPPLSISREQLGYALEAIETRLEGLSARRRSRRPDRSPSP